MLHIVIKDDGSGPQVCDLGEGKLLADRKGAVEYILREQPSSPSVTYSLCRLEPAKLRGSHRD